MALGDPQNWKDRFISLDERLFERIVNLWPSCLALLLPGQPEEDPITINLVALLSKDPVVRRLCHWIEYQYEPFGTAANGAKFSKGKIDLAVLLDRERERYLAYECKRLNVIYKGVRSSLAVPYVRDGMMRFMTEQYAESLPVGCMLGYVLDGDLAFALKQVSAAIEADKNLLKLVTGPSPGQHSAGIERFTTDHNRSETRGIHVRHALLPFPAPAAQIYGAVAPGPNMTFEGEGSTS